MKSITIHGLDEEMSERLARAATREGLSLNRTVKKILREALGINTSPSTDHRADFEDLFGTWTDAETAAFNKRVREFGEIDREEW
jgi:plasmid stability protein